MKVPSLLSKLALVFALVDSSYGLQLNGVDDFNDNLRSEENWGQIDPPSSLAALTESNERLEFTSYPSGMPGSAQRVWAPNVGSYTNDWFAQTIVSLPNLPFSTAIQSIHMSLVVSVVGRVGSSVVYSVLQEVNGASPVQKISGFIQKSGIQLGPAYEVVRNSAVTRLRIRFAGISKVVSLDYESEVGSGVWQTMAEYDLDAPEINMGLGDYSGFQVRLLASAYSLGIDAPSGVYFDDFLVASRPQILVQPASQVVTDCEVGEFTVEADAGPLASFHWQLDGVELSGEIGQTLMVPTTAPNRYGNYRVVISNPAGTTTSKSVQLIQIAVAPTIGYRHDGSGFHVVWSADNCVGGGVVELQKRVGVSGGGGWDNVAPPYQMVNGQFDVVFPTTEDQMLFRLIWPN